MNYSINPKLNKNEFSVPSVLLKHLAIANEEQLKVILLILGKLPKVLTPQQIAKKLDLDVDTVEKGLQYWVLTGVLKETKGETGEKEKAQEAKSEEPVKFVPDNADKRWDNMTIKLLNSEQQKEPEYTKPTTGEIGIRLNESPEIASLFRELQLILSKTIGYDGQCTILMLHDRFGLPTDVIFMLVQYCVSINKTGFNYIEAVGKNWGEQEIDTIEKASQKIEQLNSLNVFWKKFIAETGITTPKPTAKHVKYLEVWLGEWNFSYEVILKAYEIMAEKTGKISFSYMNKVLERWHSSGFTSLNDIEVNESAKKDAGKAVSGSSSEASYDIDGFREKKVYKKPVYKRKYV